MTALLFFLVLSLLVLIHELGHYVAARLCGIKAHEFGFGLPPRLIGIVKDGKRWKWVGRADRGIYKRTVWSLNWLPFGGFVRIKGEDAAEMRDQDSIMAKPMWQRMFVISAGVMMNWILAASLFSIVLGMGVSATLDSVPKDATITDRHISVTDTLPGSPADKAGVHAGDEILAVNGNSAPTAEGMHDLIRSQAAIGEVMLRIKQGNDSRELSLMPVVLSETGVPGIGIGLADIGTVSFSPGQAVVQGVYMAARMTKSVVVALAGVVTDLVTRQKVTQDLAGPVGIAIMTGEAARVGFTTLLQFAAMLSINLAVINVLPIPALDGGRLFFMVLEKIRHKPIDRNLEINIHNVAYIGLLLLIVLVSVRDVGRYGSVIVGGLKGLFGM